MVVLATWSSWQATSTYQHEGVGGHRKSSPHGVVRQLLPREDRLQQLCAGPNQGPRGKRGDANACTGPTRKAIRQHNPGVGAGVVVVTVTSPSKAGKGHADNSGEPL